MASLSPASTAAAVPCNAAPPPREVLLQQQECGSLGLQAYALVAEDHDFPEFAGNLTTHKQKQASFSGPHLGAKPHRVPAACRIEAHNRPVLAIVLLIILPFEGKDAHLLSLFQAPKTPQSVTD